jgi:LysR family nitrogen assimilation transcriptional regulator
VASIIDLVHAGHGHAVLHASAVRGRARAEELQVRALVEPRLATVLCQVSNAHKRPGPLLRQTSLLLTELARGLAVGG